MSLYIEQWQFLLDDAKLIKQIEFLGFRATEGEAYRPDILQILYFYGYTIILDENKIPKLVPTQKQLSKKEHSNHQDKLAKDYNIFYKNNKDEWIYTGSLDPLEAKKILQPVGDFWEKLDSKNVWGGNYPERYKTNFIDCPHFEKIL